MFLHIFDGLEERFQKELEVIRSQYPSSPILYTSEPLVIHWKDAIEMLKSAGYDVSTKLPKMIIFIGIIKYIMSLLIVFRQICTKI